jgi:hypothetical protein
VGKVVGVATLAGVAAHMVVTNIRKRKVIAEVHAEDQKEP